MVDERKVEGGRGVIVGLYVVVWVGVGVLVGGEDIWEAVGACTSFGVGWEGVRKEGNVKFEGRTYKES